MSRARHAPFLFALFNVHRRPSFRTVSETSIAKARWAGSDPASEVEAVRAPSTIMLLFTTRSASQGLDALAHRLNPSPTVSLDSMSQRLAFMVHVLISLTFAPN
jgi:hypothetical protein